MTVHSLKMYQLVSRTTKWYESPLVTVSVVADRWYFDKGREIEFLAMNLPRAFTFIVDARQNNAEGGRTGDARSGSWVGLATQIGPNRYQGIQSTGTTNQASGLIAFGTANSVPFGRISTSAVAGITMGANIDKALGGSYAADVVAPAVAERITYPEWGTPPTPADTIRILKFGEALEQNTKTIRSSPAIVRSSMYKFDGTVATTQFYRPTGGNAVGGVTYCAAHSTDYTGNGRNPAAMASAVPISEGGVSEKKDGDGRTAVWERYFLAGGTNVSPYRVNYLLMVVAANGTFSYELGTNVTPNGTNGSSYGSEAFTIFSDNPEDTNNAIANQNLLRDTYLGIKAKSNNFTIKRPMVVPHRFRVRTNVNESLTDTLTMTWLVSADFINHEYGVGE